MSVRHEIKSQLAKLLATEDLVVEHKKVETACFNVHTRVLTLPMWEKASNVVYDMLVGHEVGHALYTPDEDWLKTYKIPPQFVNVVEDARIEKLMKRRYPGLSKTFFSGYKELAEQDFFSLDGEDISLMNLADRANLWFKIGNHVQIPIERGEETEIINMIADTETFSDVLIAAEVLYKFCKKRQEENMKTPMDSLESQNQGSNQPASDFAQDGDESDEEGGGSNDSDDGEKQDDQMVSNHGGETSEDPKVKTMDALDEALKNLVENDSRENVYLEVPKINLKKVIVPNQEIHEKCLDTWNDYSDEYFYEVDAKFLEFKKSAQKEVNYLVKEFECKKAADSYARATTARTGVLDCSKLHTYKYNEDLFKKVTTLADGKNHGLVFVLDWSGSMSSVMLDTIKQLYNLMWFCKKVSIPFEVYAFTNEHPVDPHSKETPYERKSGMLHIDHWFSMMNIFSSKVNSKTLETQMKNIFRVAYTFNHGYSCFYRVPMGMDLSGTPLNEALMSLHEILPKFKQENKLQKVQCVVLTDGEACSPKYDREVYRPWEDNVFLGTGHIGPHCFLRDRKIGETYAIPTDWYDFTEVLLRNLGAKFKNINFIGIRILQSRDAGNFIRRYCGNNTDDYNKVFMSWKKQKTFSIKTSGYDTYFGIGSSILDQGTEFNVSDDATKSQIKSAFVKSLRNKKMNKKMLSEFIELVA